MDTPAPLSFALIPRPAFGSAAQHLAAPPRLTTKADRRYMRAAKTAAELLPDLPELGETIHALMLGSFDLCQVITATVKRVPNCRHVRIATLCYSKRNVKELCSLLEGRHDHLFALTLLVSVFHRDHNKELHETATADLSAFPNVRVGAGRNHCKVTTFDLGGDDGLTFEGSANLRSNKNREQLAVTRDRALCAWHSAWIDDMVRADDGGPNARP